MTNVAPFRAMRPGEDVLQSAWAMRVWNQRSGMNMGIRVSEYQGIRASGLQCEGRENNIIFYNGTNNASQS